MALAQLGGIKNWLINAVIKAAVTKLITMFNPVGGLIEAAKAIYNTVMFFIERMQQIAALVDSIFSSIGKIVAGDTDAASNYIEQAMARTIPVVISFFARLLGLGGISDRIKAVIQRIQAPINRALDKLEQKIADKARTLLDRNQRQNQPPQPGATTPVTAPAPQSQPPSSATPQAPVSTSTPPTTAPASQSPSSSATTPTRTQTPPSQQGNSNQQNAPNNNSNQADHDRKVQIGLIQINQEEKKYLASGKINKKDAEKVAKQVKKDNPIFKSITVVDGGKTWNYRWIASEGTQTGGQKAENEIEPHKSKYVEIVDGKYMLKKEYQNTNSRTGKPTVRTRFYGVRYRKIVNDWKDERLNTPKGQNTPSGYIGIQNPQDATQYWWNGKWWKNEGKTKASIEHKLKIVKHWNSKGRDITQPPRLDHFSDINNLDIMPRSQNSAEGCEENENYEFEVGKDFRGPRE